MSIDSSFSGSKSIISISFVIAEVSNGLKTDSVVISCLGVKSGITGIGLMVVSTFSILGLISSVFIISLQYGQL